MEHIDTLGKRIRWERTVRMNLTQVQFAAALGVTENTIKNYENGTTVPSGVELNKIHEIDNLLDLNWLITGEGEPITEKGDRELEIELQLRKRIDELQNELLNGFRNNKKD